MGSVRMSWISGSCIAFCCAILRSSSDICPVDICRDTKLSRVCVARPHRRASSASSQYSTLLAANPHRSRAALFLARQSKRPPSHTDLSVCNRVRFLILFASWTHLRNGLHRALAALLELAVARVVLQARVIRLQRLVVLLHEVLQVALAAVALRKVWRQTYALVRVLSRRRWRELSARTLMGVKHVTHKSVAVRRAW